MKYTLVVRQAAAADAGLIGRVTPNDLCLLDYLCGWFFCERAKIEIVEGQKFVWLRYETAIEELPLLFNSQAQITSLKNQLTALMKKLRKAGLVETRKNGRRLFFRLTDLAVRVANRSEHSAPTAAKPASIVTPPHDGTVTPGQDETVMPLRDEYVPANITETGIKESERKETPPVSPCKGDAESILVFWNSIPQLQKAQTLTPGRSRKIRRRLADPYWRAHWQEAIRRIAVSNFANGGGLNGWRATLDWFLGGDSLTKIMEGQFDNRSQPDRKLVVSDIKAQIKAVDETIAMHPANDDSAFYDQDATQEQREDLRKLHHRRNELVRQLTGVPRTSRQPDDVDY